MEYEITLKTLDLIVRGIINIVSTGAVVVSGSIVAAWAIDKLIGGFRK